MDNPFKSPIVLSTCYGFGLLEAGLGEVLGEYRAAAYVEIEAFCIINLVAKMESGLVAPNPIWSNLKTFPAPSFHRRIHGITGGYPCQPFSVAGKQLGTADPRHLWPYYEQHIRAIEPVWCFFENVSAHLRLGYKEVRASLEHLGYSVEQGVYSAEEAGAPHQRKRLFILAIRKDFLGYAKHYGPAAFQKPRGNGEDAKYRSEGRAISPEQLTRADRPNPEQGQFGNPTGEWLANGNGLGSYKSMGGGSQNSLTKMAANGRLVQEKHSTRGKSRAPLKDLPYQMIYERWGLSFGRIIVKAYRKKTGKKLRLRNIQVLNPAWVAQLMGTTLEKTFFVGTETEWYHKWYKSPCPTCSENSICCSCSISNQTEN